jgi:Cu-processing system permease protein
MMAIFTFARLTLFEARRKRILFAAILCGVAFLVVFATGVFLPWRELLRRQISFVERQGLLVMFTLAGLYAANFLSVLFAVLLPVDAVSGEIDSGVMQTLASKPVRRADVVLGKWLGHWIVVAMYLMTLSGGVLLVSRSITGFVPPSVVGAISLMLLEVTLLMTVSIAGGTRFSTVTNGIASLGFYGIAFVGGWVEQIGALGGIQSARTLGVVVSLISPADSLWRLASYNLQPAVVRDLGAVVFTSASVPTALMVWWAGGFTLVMLVVAVRSFEKRQL